MNAKLLTVSDTTAVGGLAVGLSQIYTILGIICTFVSLVVLIVNFIIRIHDRLKDGKMDKQELEWTIDDVTKLASKIVELQDQLADAEAKLEDKEKDNGNNN